METALIGLLGVLLGIVLNEQLRRRNRIENYSTSVFDRRLDLYEELFRRVSKYSEVATEVIENDELTKEQRHELVSAALHEVAGFCDEHELYLNEELTVHCFPILAGVEEIHYIKDKDKRDLEIKGFRDNLLAAKRMIRKEAGIADLDKLYHSITKAKHSSPIIEYYRKRMKELGIKGKWE
jgi:hypothetical protein